MVRICIADMIQGAGMHSAEHSADMQHGAGMPIVQTFCVEVRQLGSINTDNSGADGEVSSVHVWVRPNKRVFTISTTDIFILLIPCYGDVK